MIRFTIGGLGLVAGIALLAGVAGAADPAPGAPAEPTPAQRQTMADIHRKMADCLGSERPFAECRADMQQNCVTMMGPVGCPMMGGGMMGSGAMGGGMMNGPGMMGGQKPPPPKP